MSDYKDNNIWLMQGDCLERMKEIPDGSVDLTVTSPLTTIYARITEIMSSGANTYGKPLSEIYIA